MRECPLLLLSPCSLWGDCCCSPYFLLMLFLHQEQNLIINDKWPLLPFISTPNLLLFSDWSKILICLFCLCAFFFFFLQYSCLILKLLLSETDHLVDILNSSLVGFLHLHCSLQGYLISNAAAIWYSLVSWCLGTSLQTIGKRGVAVQCTRCVASGIQRSPPRSVLVSWQ